MDKQYRVFYGGTAATKEQLDAIEEIVVEQEIGLQWMARIKIPVCIKEDGSWGGENEDSYKVGKRVRIEAKIGETDFVPLIDGVLVQREPDYNASPGSSVITLVVYDDTNKLNQIDESEPFIDQTDSEIVTSILTAAALGGSVDVDNVSAGVATNTATNRRGSPMAMLRAIMARNPGFHIYVLPGSGVGTSDAFFKTYTTDYDPGLPIMYISGPDQNISGFRITENSNRAMSVGGAHLSMSDKTINTATAGHDDTPPASGASATTGTDLRTRRLPPGIGDLTDLTEAAEGAASESSYTLSADGSVLPLCFNAVLIPYRVVRVMLSNSRFSGNYLIHKVTHTLGISEYTQSFSVRSNAISEESPLSAGLPQASADLAVSFNVQVDIV